ncbi:MAG: hypothetical protein Q8N98_04155, partial [bacterium]|nr:hypothetical protein [bacterium]
MFANSQQLVDLFRQAQNILILGHQNPTYDLVAAMTGLHWLIVDSGKKSTMACPDLIPPGKYNELFGSEQIKNRVETEIKQTGPIKGPFIISLPYSVGSIDKVAYDVVGDRLKLTIQPGPNGLLFGKDDIRYETGGEMQKIYDLIFILDTPDPSLLGSLYDQAIFAGTPTVNIDKHANNTNYGTVNFIEPAAFCVSELIIGVCKALNITAPSVDVATNVLYAIEETTDSLRAPNVSSETLEAAAFCLKNGAVRRGNQISSPDWGFGGQNAFSSSSVTPSYPPVNPTAWPQDLSRPVTPIQSGLIP